MQPAKTEPGHSLSRREGKLRPSTFVATPRALTFSDGTQHQDAGLLDHPLGVEEEPLEQREEVGQQLLPEDVGQDVQGSGRALP